jgi:hypothetical protein
MERIRSPLFPSSRTRLWLTIQHSPGSTARPVPTQDPFRWDSCDRIVMDPRGQAADATPEGDYSGAV